MTFVESYKLFQIYLNEGYFEATYSDYNGTEWLSADTLNEIKEKIRIFWERELNTII
jgi:hypothetical protein